MPDASNTFVMQIFLLCLILVGLISAKTRMVDEHSRSSLSELILNIFLPCNILSSFFDANSSKLPSMGFIFIISLGIILFCYIFGKHVFYRRVGTEQKKVLLYATIITNASFIGNPVIESIFGREALIYSAAFILPLRVALWTLGVSLFAGKAGFKRLILHPCLLATYLGFILMITGFIPPPLVSRLVFSLGDCTTPISMIMVGSVLGQVKPKQVFTGLTLYYTFIRLVLIPLAVLGVLFFFRPAPEVSGVSVILSGTPAPVTTSILANKYGGDRELASKIIFTSTLLSIATIPLLIWLLQFF